MDATASLTTWDFSPPAAHRDDSDGANPRKRRRKYIAKACNECKRRKIKCNGETPCQRCGRQRIDCIYDKPPRHTDGESDQQVYLEQLCKQMSAMQEQIETLSAAVTTLTQHSVTATAIAARSDAAAAGSQRPFRRRRSTIRETAFQGPTTSAFSLHLAKSNLLRQGIVEQTDGAEDADADADANHPPSPLPPDSPGPATLLDAARPEGDPLWSLDKAEAMRLCRVYEEEMGMMYPVLDLQDLLDQVEVVYGSSSAAAAVAARPEGSRAVPHTDDVQILRLVFACALTAEAAGSSELAMRLFESVREVADNCVWGPSEIKSIILLTLVAIFYFQIDEEILAWRIAGIVERMCLEKGLHRRETLGQPAIVAAGRDRVLRLFWSIYILDIRWSFGTGMPFSLEDSDIDPWLPEPEEKTPYLRVMIRYSRIAAKVWKFISAFNNTNEIKKDEMNYLDWQVQQWVMNIPEILRLEQPPLSASKTEPKPPRSLHRLRALLYLRSNQLRMLIHRPVLHSAAHIVRYPAESQMVVDLARETIRFITRLNETTDIYRLQQVTFNWFLVSAVAVLFLAVAQAPSQFGSVCREDFYLALELIKGFSTKSYISLRLWKSIRSLRKLGPQVMRRQPEAVEAGPEGADVLNSAKEQEIEQASGAVEPSMQSTGSIHSLTPVDGVQMTRELMEWFEAVGSLETQIMGMGALPPHQETDVWGRSGQYMVDYGGELSSVMKDCF
ncbi:putative C6 transcription factor [Aspergillus brunneoviolaceus CBS 621.78]|uniref:Uncharacterized protein n=1 Tax=Aspergillus brunneoviolaceus CBS 621.78 TaxID=1450534 RepID=A0ACD1GJ94_9EURO|nr:hypothetical protein BO95DRAFT_450442 [Aspergillus brunneoviolaceus CBS 621.78]RAH49310.1 hypothetical protein BO95DRAFT_450442 [Aspergillus brunneoviolaceus CBS 621.78]